MIPLLFIFFSLGLDVRVSRYAHLYVSLFFGGLEFVVANPLFMSPILYFGELSGFEPRELPYRIDQARTNLATHLPCYPPVSLSSYPSPSLAINFLTLPPI
jgi:hypothetical protein